MWTLNIVLNVYSSSSVCRCYHNCNRDWHRIEHLLLPIQYECNTSPLSMQFLQAVTDQATVSAIAASRRLDRSSRVSAIQSVPNLMSGEAKWCSSVKPYVRRACYQWVVCKSGIQGSIRDD